VRGRVQAVEKSVVKPNDQHTSMSFREKSAWISAVSLAVLGGIYFLNFASMLRGRAALSDVELFFALVIALVAVEVVLHLAIAIRSPKEARTPRDERERLIDLKATRIAFFVLLAGAFASIGTVHLRLRDSGDHTFVMMHCVLFSIVVAEVVKFGSQIALYRRDA
jgi:hypothetical protein